MFVHIRLNMQRSAKEKFNGLFIFLIFRYSTGCRCWNDDLLQKIDQNEPFQK